MKLTFYLIFLILAIMGDTNVAQKNKLDVNQRNQTNFVVETALFCDKECGEYFNYDRNKTVNYLLALVLDANMYFTSIQNYNLILAVTSFTQLNNTKDQPFVEESRRYGSTLSLSSILLPFGRWLSNFTNKLPEFDFAILFTGSTGGVDRAHTYSNSLCFKNNENVFWGASVFRLFVSKGSVCNEIAKAVTYGFGHTGTVNIKTDTNHDSCWDKEYVFETNDSSCSSPHKYFFSNCSAKVIGSYFLLNKTHCLGTGKHGNYFKYAVSYDAIVTPTMTKQCQIAAKRADVYSKPDQEHCLKTSCYEFSNSIESFVKDMYPLANTPCGESKICFRGRCISKGYRLQNTNNSNCFVTSNRFSYNDKPVISQCAELSTPLDRLMLLDRGNNTFYLATPYSTPDAEENADKCLNVDCRYNNLMFDRCPEDNSSWFEWLFIKHHPNEQTFLVFHPNTQKCVTINQSSTLLYITECNFNQSLMKWKLIEKNQADIFVVLSTSEILTANDNLARLAFLSQKNDNTISPDSSDMFGLGILSGVVLTCVLVTAFFIARHILKVTKFGTSRNGYPTTSAVYHREQNVELLEN